VAGEPRAPEPVASVGALDPVADLVREFLHRSGAIRIAAVVDDEHGEPALIDCGRFSAIQVTIGERTVVLPHSAPLDVEPPDPGDVRRLPPFDVDAAAGEIAGPIGGLEHLARAVRALAQQLGGRSVAMAQFETTTPGLALSISAREGEPLVVAIGDDEYEMDPGWPAASVQDL
jgi:hypothetical protein